MFSTKMFLMVSLTLLPGLSFAAAESAERESAAQIADQVLAAVGGAEGWAATHHLRFTFAGARTHHWDVRSGDHRLEGTTREGVAYVVLSNVNTKTGTVWLDGTLAEGEAASEWLERAYGAWINDTYWLLLPFKLQDPGVNLSRLDDVEIDGARYQVLELTFGEVGLTPGDRYRVYVDPSTSLVARWDYVLESFEAGREATAWIWGGWERHGSIQLATSRTMVGDTRELPLSNLGVFDELPRSVYEDPAPISGD